MRFAGMGGIAVVAVLACSSVAHADERKFTYSYESKTLPQGVLELEQWATLSSRTDAGHFSNWRFREELEYGLADRLTTALYLNWEYTGTGGRGTEPEHEAKFETVSNEWKYKVADATADPVGILLYGEWAAGADEQELEFKLVLDKRFGPFILAYNLVVELEREKEVEAGGGSEWENGAVLWHTFGVSYQANPNFALGAEAFLHQDFGGFFKDREHLAFFAGPNLSVSAGRWWGTLTMLRQFDAGDGLVFDEHAKYEFRLIVGFNF
jgi:hypothetical protein